MDLPLVGVPLAVGPYDRDGLEIDVLHVPLGPVLPYGRPGSLLRCALDGDVVTEATSSCSRSGRSSATAASALPFRDAAAACDNGAARLLAVAGWYDAAAAARRVRDLDLIDPADGARAQLDRLRSRVAGSWSLRWLLRGLGVIDDAALGRTVCLPRRAATCSPALVAMLDRAQAGARGTTRAAAHRSKRALAALPQIVSGRAPRGQAGRREPRPGHRRHRPQRITPVSDVPHRAGGVGTRGALLLAVTRPRRRRARPRPGGPVLPAGPVRGTPRRPLAEVARMLRQPRRTTVAADVPLWRTGGAGLLVAALLMVVVVSRPRQGRQSSRGLLGEGFVVISICPEALSSARRDTPDSTMIFLMRGTGDVSDP